jgi:hypothetical protein
MMLSKKGIMFTVLAVLLSAVVLASFFSIRGLPIDNDVENTKLRVQGINNYISQSERYMDSITRIAATKTLNFTIDIMIGNNSFLGNYTEEYVSCMKTGRMKLWNNSVINCPTDSNLTKKVKQFEEFSKTRMNLDTTLTVNDVSLTQSDPWNIVVIVNYTIKINDSYAVWEENKILQSYVDITGYRDPTYYIVNSTNPVFQVRYPMYVEIEAISATDWVSTPSTIHSLIVRKKYFAWPEAPDFLSRLNNNVAPSGDSGIVSIVSPDFIDESKLPVNFTKLSVDYMYWKNITPTSELTYKRYNFWKPYVDPRYYGVNASNPGLNGTVLPSELRTYVNMNNDVYLEPVSLS